jgi:hypothetical protein
MPLQASIFHRQNGSLKEYLQVVCRLVPSARFAMSSASARGIAFYAALARQDSGAEEPQGKSVFQSEKLSWETVSYYSGQCLL